MRRFENRQDAGRKLAAALATYARRDVLVLALPCGGVPVAHEVASALRVPLDVWIVRKVTMPGREEIVLGAVALGEQDYIDQTLVARLRIPEQALGRALAQATQELQRRNQRYRKGKPVPQLDGLTVILVDDGLVSGASMRVAIQSVQRAHARGVVVAVPVASPSICRELAACADRVICLEQPEFVHSVASWYEDFTPTGDDEVGMLLALQPVHAAPQSGLRP